MCIRDRDRQEKFKNFNFDTLDGKSAARIVDAIEMCIRDRSPVASPRAQSSIDI